MKHHLYGAATEARAIIKKKGIIRPIDEPLKSKQFKPAPKIEEKESGSWVAPFIVGFCLGVSIMLGIGYILFVEW